MRLPAASCTPPADRATKACAAPRVSTAVSNSSSCSRRLQAYQPTQLRWQQQSNCVKSAADAAQPQTRRRTPLSSVPSDLENAAVPAEQGADRQDDDNHQHQQQQQRRARIPPEQVWRAELRHLQGLLVNPHKPLQRAFVLQQCYTLNSSDTQARFRQLSPQAMGKIAADRHRLEGRVSRAAHALSSAWKRLLLLQEAVLEQGAALTEPQLAKERELVVGIRDRLKQAQRLHSRTISQAEELGDTAYTRRANTLGRLLSGAHAAAESFLNPGLSNIAAVSKVNTTFRNAWAKTPPAQRPPPAVAESQRQAQLAPLLPLLPEGPQGLLQSYKAAALSFQLHTDPHLMERTPSSGLPSSAGSTFWSDQQQLGALEVKTTPPYAQPDRFAGMQQQQDPQQEQQQQQQQQSMVPPLRPSAGQPVWQQPPQQLLSRPVQTLPLLPHLAKPWVVQQTARFRAQQEEEHKQQQLAQLEAMQWPEVLPRTNTTAADHGGRGPTTAPHATAPSRRSERAPLSLSGKVLPPLPALLQRALEVEEQLLERRRREGGVQQ